MKKILLFIILIGVLGVGGYKYLYKGHRDIATEKVYSTKESLEFISEISNLGKLPQEYVDKTVQISGTVTGFTEKEITLDEKLFFQFETLITQASIGKKVTIKARCIGFDDLLEEVKFDQATLIQ